jgi:hypothetical protein
MGHPGKALCLLAVWLLVSVWAGAQQPQQTKNVPAMTSDDGSVPFNATRAATFSEETPKTQATPAGWIRYFPANCGLSIALPRRPLEADLPISAQDKALFRSGSNSFYTDGSLTVIAAHFQTVTPTPASSIVDSFFEGLSEGKGLKDLKYSAKETSRATRTDVYATYRADEWLDLEGFIEVTGTHGWLVVAIHPQGKVKSKEKGRRILDSALFDGPSCID